MITLKDLAFPDSTQPTETNMNSFANRQFAAGSRNAMSDRGTINSQRA